jgi:hypothetical protein
LSQFEIFFNFNSHYLTMWLIIGLFFLGIIAGSLLKRVGRIISISSKLTFISVLSLLFLLGYQAGSNQSVRTHFDTLGVQGFTIAILSVLGSIVVVFLFSRYILKK